MKAIALFLSLIFAATAIAAPPLGVSGQSDTNNKYPSVIKVGNKLATDLGSGQSLLELGNANLLQNPSFEHATFNTGWTCTGVTPVVETGTVVHGKKSMKITGSATTFECYQDSTINAAGLASVDMLAMIRAKTSSVTGIKVCARQGGTTSTSLCDDKLDNTFNPSKVQFSGNSTSNGIAIVGTSYTGTLYLDEASVGAVDVKQDVSGTSLEGTISWTAAASCLWGVTSDTWTSYVADTDCSSGTTTGYVSAPSSKIPGFQINVVAGTTYQIHFSGLMYNSTNGYKYWRFTDGTDVTNHLSSYLSGDSTTFGIFYYTPTSSGLKTIQIQARAGGSVGTASLYNDSVDMRFTVMRVATTSNYSTNSNGDPYRISEVIFTSQATAPSGFISALNKSIGQAGSGATFTGDAYYALYEVLWSQAGVSTTAGHVYRISTAKGSTAAADWAANKTITIDYETNGAFIRAKSAARNAGAYEDSDNKSHTHSVTGYWETNSGGNGYLATNPSAVNGNSVNGIGSSGGTEAKPNAVSLYAYIRYTASREIVIGQFNGLESCADSYQCEDTYTADSSSTAVVSKENLEWITGNGTVSPAGRFAYTFKTGLFTVAPNCLVSAGPFGAGGDYQCAVNAVSATSLVVDCASGSTLASFQHTISCQKQGADYIGKTAKAVASDQNVRTPGVTKAVLVSAALSSGGAVSNEYGDFINGNCTNATPSVCTFSTNFFAATPNCEVNVVDNTANQYTCKTSATSSSSVSIRCENNSSLDVTTGASKTIFCHGYTP